MLKVFLITQLYDENPAWKIKLPDSDPDQLYEYHETNFMMSVLIRSYWKTNLGQKMRKLHFIQCRKKLISYHMQVFCILYFEMNCWLGAYFFHARLFLTRKSEILHSYPNPFVTETTFQHKGLRKKMQWEKCFNLNSLCQ